MTALHVIVTACLFKLSESISNWRPIANYFIATVSLVSNRKGHYMSIASILGSNDGAYNI